jgi:hypothetical protein
MNQKDLDKILPIAHSSNYLKPEKEIDPCLASQVNTANFILYHLKSSENGLSTSQVSDRTGFALNTVKCYLRKLLEMGLISKNQRGGEEAIWHFVEQTIIPEKTAKKGESLNIDSFGQSSKNKDFGTVSITQQQDCPNESSFFPGEVTDSKVTIPSRSTEYHQKNFYLVHLNEAEKCWIPKDAKEGKYFFQYWKSEFLTLTSPVSHPFGQEWVISPLVKKGKSDRSEYPYKLDLKLFKSDLNREVRKAVFEIEIIKGKIVTFNSSNTYFSAVIPISLNELISQWILILFYS